MKKTLLPVAGCALLTLAACGAADSGPAADPSHKAPSAAQEARPQRIVSLNLCADQLLVELADRNQIAGLTRNADDLGMSAVAAKVGGLRLLGNAAEQILDIRPDLMIGMPTRRSAMLDALPDYDYQLLDLKTAHNVPDIVQSIRQTAQAVGHVDRGEAMIAKMQSDLTQVEPVGKGRVAAYYQRRGYMTGTGTLMDDMMGRVGLTNLAKTLDKPSLAQLSLEEMVAAKPDFIIMESATQHVNDQGSEMLHHSALRDVARIVVPEAWTVCGGPAYTQAVRSLHTQIVEHDRRHR